VTCGLPYTNGPCHLGHLRTYIPADFYVRYMRRSGHDVVFICGSDNHGTPVVVSAESEKTTPRQLSEFYHRHFETTLERMGVRFDRFGMTDDPTNHRRTGRIMESLIANGYIYPRVVRQSYCPNCERFLPDRYVEGICPHCGTPARGDECDQGCGRPLEPGEITRPTCRICGSDAVFREQEHYFFKLSQFADYIGSFLVRVQGTTNARNYAMGWVREGLRDWCITRTLDWGVKFPGRDDLVVYVWVDAPIGYISFTEEWASASGHDWKDYWCNGSGITHFIGGDIIYHHCIFWPALLKAAGYGEPGAVVASGMVKVDDHKFSKSRGYVVWTNEDYLDKGLPADYLRYYLLSYTNHTKELNFSWKVFQERINNELVNTLGNFIYRSLYLAHKEFGRIPDGAVSREIIDEIARCQMLVSEAIDGYEFKSAVDAVMGLAAFGNNYIQTHAPWKLLKTNREEAGQVLKNCLQIVKALALLVEPVMPESAQRCWEMIGSDRQVHEEPIGSGALELAAALLPEPRPLFEKLDDSRIGELEDLLKIRVNAAHQHETKAGFVPEPVAEPVSIDEFCRMDVRIGVIISAEAIPKSAKLLKLMVDIGGEKRQIVSGIAQFYKPEDLPGKEVALLVNLKPALIFGIESNGMILAAGNDASLLIPIRKVPPGTKVR
jgi:methionyl-tRNA synthetase